MTDRMEWFPGQCIRANGAPRVVACPVPGGLLTTRGEFIPHAAVAADACASEEGSERFGQLAAKPHGGAVEPFPVFRAPFAFPACNLLAA